MNEWVITYFVLGLFGLAFWRAWLSSEPYVQIRLRLDRKKRKVQRH